MALGNIHLTPQLVDAVRDAVDIVDIASDNTRLRKAGHRYSGLCPLHKEKSPSFSVDPDQGLFYCFGCGSGGDAIKLHMLLTGDDFPGAIETLAQRYGIPLPRREAGRGGGREGPELGPVLEAALEFFRDSLKRASEPRAYLERRRIPGESIESFELGYAPDGWRHLLEALQPRIPMESLFAAGLVTRSDKGGHPYDRFRHRLMFPIRAPSGRLLGFGGRTLGDDKAKYINTNETPQFQKGRLLYGLDKAKRSIREGSRALLVEGYFDVIGAVVSGIDWAVAGMGTALTAEQAKLLSRYADNVVVGYDGDQAGEKAFTRSLPVLLGERLTVHRCRFGEGHDPDSLRVEAGPEAVVRAVEDAADGVLLELDRRMAGGVALEPKSQAVAAKEVAELLAAMPDAVLRVGYVRQAANRLGIPEDLLHRRLSRSAGRSRTAGAESPQEPADHRSSVRSVEETTICLLLDGTQEVPPMSELPPPDAFHRPPMRNIYSAYCDLYREETSERPDAKALQAHLEAAGAEVDHLARLLLEDSFASGPGASLAEELGKIWTRWIRQEQKDLVRRIHRAQQDGDLERIPELLQRKQDLSRELHFKRGRTSRDGRDG